MGVSLVTGAGSGIGKATAIRLGRRGDSVVCLDIDGDGAERTAHEITEAIVIQASVTDESAMEKAVEETLEAFGDIDCAVASAGVGGGQDVLSLDFGHFRHVVEVNLTGSAVTARAAALGFLGRGHGGSIVLLGSISSQIATVSRAAYSASKGGVLMLGRALAVELAEHSIRVNVVGPGPIRTPMTDALVSDPGKWEPWKRRIPQGRPGEPDEVAAVIEFLTSEGASYVTGAFIPIDGGLLAH